MRISKTFKIGEEAVGGKINVLIKNKTIIISALDWYDETSIVSAHFLIYGDKSKHYIKMFLNELTTHYYSEKILDWIETKIKFEDEFNPYVNIFSLN